MDYLDLDGPDGQTDNMGGLTQRFYFARVADFLAIQTPTLTPTTPEDTVKITTTHTFKTGKKWQVGYCTIDKGKFSSDPQGETDGISLKMKMEVFIPGSSAKLHGFANMAKNDRFICLAEMPDGSTLQVGTQMFFAQFKPKFETGTNSGGIRGYIFEVESMGPKNLVYSGAITLTPAP